MTARFLDRLDLTHVGYGPRPYVTLAPLRFEDTDGTIYAVPQDYATDLASIPWVVRALPGIGWGQSGPWDAAAVLHDWHCRIRVLPSAEVHRLFGRALASLPAVNGVRRALIGTLVRWFGPRWAVDGR